MSRIMYWPEMPKSIAMSTLSRLHCDLVHALPAREAVVDKIHASHLVDRAVKCSCIRSLAGRLQIFRQRASKLAFQQGR